MPIFEVVKEPEVARMVRFSTGHLNPQTKGELDFKCFRDKANKRKLVVTTEVNSVEYTGQNFGQSNIFSTDNCDYYVAVQRKGADKIQILPAELFHLNPKMEEKQGTSISDSDSDGEGKEKPIDKIIRKYHDLTTQFGSGLSQKNMRRSQAQKLDDSALNMMSRSVFVTPKKPSTPEGKDSKIVESSVVPPHNKNADKPEDVYLLETIIPDSVMGSLREQCDIFVNCVPSDIAKWSKENTYSSVVLSLLENLPHSSEERKSKCSLIMYLHCLMYSYNLKATQLKKTRYPGEWKGPVKKLLDDNFTVCTEDSRKNIRRLRPLYLKDRLLSHILILSMRLQDYSIALNPFVQDLKLNIKRLVIHTTTLGFKVSGTLNKVAKLTVPFSLPPPSVKKKGK